MSTKENRRHNPLGDKAYISVGHAQIHLLPIPLDRNSTFQPLTHCSLK